MAVTSATAAGKAAQASGRGQAPRADPVAVGAGARPNFGTRRGAPLPTQARRKDDGTAKEDIFSPSAYLAEEVDFSAMALDRTSDTAAGSEGAAAGVRRGAARKARKSTSKAIAAESKSTAYTPPASSLTLAAAQVPAPSSNHLNLGQKNLFRHPPTSTLLSSMLSSAEGEDIAEDEDMADASPSAVATYRSSAMMEEMSLSSAHLRSDDLSSLSPQKFSSASGSFTSGLVLDPATRTSLGPTQQDRIRRMAEVLSIGADFLPQENQSFFGGVLAPPGGSDGGEDDPEELIANRGPSSESAQARKDGRKLKIDFPALTKNPDQFVAGCMGSMMESFQDPELKAKAAALGGFHFDKAVNAGGGLSKEDQRWEAGFEKVERHVRTTGHVNSEADESAYRWLEKQKEQAAKGELSEEKLARLQKLLGVPVDFDPKTSELPPPTDGPLYSPMEAFTILRKYSHLNIRQLKQLKERMLPRLPLENADHVSAFVTKYADTEDPESLTWEDIFPHTASVRTALADPTKFTSPVPAHVKEKRLWPQYMNHAHGTNQFEQGHVFTKEELDGAATESHVLSFLPDPKQISFNTAKAHFSALGHLLQHTDVGRALKTLSRPGTVFHEYMKKCKGCPDTFGKGSGSHNHTKPRKTKAPGGRRQNQALRGVGKQPAKKRSIGGGGKQQPKQQRKKAGGGKQPAKKQRNDGGGGKQRATKQSDAEEFDTEENYTKKATKFAAI